MEKISLKDITFKIDRRGEQPRQILVNKICYELGIEDKWKRGIFFSGVSDADMIECWQKARSFKANPGALFNKLLRDKKTKNV